MTAPPPPHPTQISEQVDAVFCICDLDRDNSYFYVRLTVVIEDKAWCLSGYGNIYSYPELSHVPDCIIIDVNNASWNIPHCHLKLRSYVQM